MSMLAERRRKQRISVDPQNKTWANDQNKYGQRLLTKMGWKGGAGLGASEQGIADPVKLQANLTGKGLGCNTRADDTWLAHQDAFDEILASLNNGNEVNTTNDESIADASSRQSLVKMSTRVRYHKFAKSKDTYASSTSDVSAVLGRQSKKRKGTSTKEGVPKKDVKESGDNSEQFSTNSTSVGDYYKAKMAEKLKKLKRCDDDNKS